MDPDHVLVIWFTDDAGNRWQLDEFMHLQLAADENTYEPTPMSRPRLPGTADANGDGTVNAPALPAAGAPAADSADTRASQVPE